jgi:hypothetical protein
VTLREQWEQREQAWRRFHQWEAAEPAVGRDASRIISDLGAILDWMPADARLVDPDPKKLGVRKMLKGACGLERSAMTDLETAVLEAVSALEACSIPFMLIGGQWRTPDTDAEIPYALVWRNVARFRWTPTPRPEKAPSHRGA